MVSVGIHNITKIKISRSFQEVTGSHVLKLIFTDYKRTETEITIFSDKELKLEEIK